jgi:hypothetical protein
MQKKILKSLSDLSVLKENLPTRGRKLVTEGTGNVIKRNPNSSKRKATDSGVSPWEAVERLLSNKLFEDIASGLVDRISSKNYSIVLAVLTYPTKSDSFISQENLDKAHEIASRIKRGLKTGRVKYTQAKIPTPWRIGGNPGTRN